MRAYSGGDGRWRGLLVWIAVCGLVAACAADETVGVRKSTEGRKRLVARDDASELSPEPDQGSRIVVLGNSLAAGYGLEKQEAFPDQLAQLLAARGHAVEVINAGVSGDTTAGGLRRLAWLLRQRPDILVVELGANDGLRGLPLEDTERNLDAIVVAAQKNDVRVLLVGMQVPPNYGDEYARDFQQLFPRLAARHAVSLVPFLLEGVGGHADLNLADGIHPTAEGHQILARNVLPYVLDLLDTLPTP